jgi:hypothetical protein
MIITVDISMYPLDNNYIPPITDFILDLRKHKGLNIVTNQLSTQVSGEFEVVTKALNTSMLKSMSEDRKVIFVTRYLNADLDIQSLPEIG